MIIVFPIHMKIYIKLDIMFLSLIVLKIFKQIHEFDLEKVGSCQIYEFAYLANTYI